MSVAGRISNRRAAVASRLVAAPDSVLEPPEATEGRPSRRLLVATSFVVLVPTAVLAFLRPPLPIEVSVLTWIDGALAGAIDGPMSFLDDVGRASVMSPAFVALAAALVLTGRHRAGGAVLAAAAATLVTNVVVKALVGRPRPDLWAVEVESIGSYPSGHTLFVTVLFGLLAGVLRGTRWHRLVLTVGVLGSFSMAFSRLYLGEHFPSDVVASLCIGVLIVVVVDHFIGLSPMRPSQHPPE